MKHLKHQVLSMAIIAGSATAGTLPTELRDYLNAAQGTAPEARATEFRQQAAKYEVREALSNFLPQISYTQVDTRTEQRIAFASQQAVNGNESKYDTDERYWSVSQAVVDVPKMWQHAAAKTGERRAGVDREVARQDFRDDYVALYLEGLSALERMEAARMQVRYLATRAAREEAEVNAGRVSVSVYAITLSSLAEAKAERVAAKTLFDAVSTQFCALGRDQCPTIRPVSLQYPLEPKVWRQALASGDSIEGNPELRSLELGVRRVEQEMSQVKAGFLPAVTLEFERRTDDNGGSVFDGSSVVEKDIYRLRATFKPFEGGRKFASLGRRTAESRALMAERELRVREIKSDLARAAGGAEAAYAADRTLRSVVSAQKHAVDLAMAQYRAGREPIDKVFEVKAELARLEVAQHRARREFIQSLVSHERSLGQAGTYSLSLLDRLVAAPGKFSR